MRRLIRYGAGGFVGHVTRAVSRWCGGVDAAVEVTRRTRRAGTDYGGWTYCDEGLGPGAVVYSFGIGEDVSFDLALIERHGVEVHAFDPTPRSVAWVNALGPPPGLYVHAWGLAGRDGTATFYPPGDPAHVSHSIVARADLGREGIQVPMRRLSTILSELGHDRLDLLKLDVEGAEYEVVEDLVSTGVYARQLLVEFHHRFPEIGVQRTNRAIRMLHEIGYRIFDVAPSGEEIGFLRV